MKNKLEKMIHYTPAPKERGIYCINLVYLSVCVSFSLSIIFVAVFSTTTNWDAWNFTVLFFLRHPIWWNSFLYESNVNFLFILPNFCCSFLSNNSLQILKILAQSLFEHDKWWDSFLYESDVNNRLVYQVSNYV